MSEPVVPRSRRLWLAVATFGCIAAGGDPPTPVADREQAVHIDNFTFSPAQLVVPVGTTVVWTNRDDIPHTVAAADGGDLRSAPLDTGDHFSFTFAKAGTFRYFCSIHPKMQGTIVVR
jgi:plastocyanin